MIDLKQAQDVANLIFGLSEPHRIRIVEILRSGSRNVTELATLLDAEIVNASHHLGVMRLSGLVLADKRGRFVNYSLNPKYFNNENSKAITMDLGWCRIELPHH